MDIYRPVEAAKAPSPVVVFVTGYSDVAGRKVLGCNLKEMASYIDWARLIARAQGQALLNWATNQPDAEHLPVFLGRRYARLVQLGEPVRVTGAPPTATPPTEGAIAPPEMRVLPRVPINSELRSREIQDSSFNLTCQRRSTRFWIDVTISGGGVLVIVKI
jgi:hypothetical protein